VARIGSRRALAVEWWQPLGAGSDWHIVPTVRYEAGPQDIFENGHRVARASVSETGAGIAVGRHFSNWGEVRLGVSRSVVRARLVVPEDPSQEGRFAGNSRFVALSVDTLDSVAFPSRGVLVQASWEQPIAQNPGEPTPFRSQAGALAAFGVGGWAGHVDVEWGRSQVGLAPLSLGGFLRLSGTEPDSVDGRVVVLGRVVLARRVGTFAPPLGGAVRAGFSLELGGGFATDEAVRLGDLKRAASGFFAVDTRFGPVYFGLGATQGGSSSLYLFVGPIW
jgi:NTE family protein